MVHRRRVPRRGRCAVEGLTAQREPGEEHWHGAAPNRFMTHIAMLEVDDEGNPAAWGDHVTDEEYAAAPSVDESGR